MILQTQTARPKMAHVGPAPVSPAIKSRQQRLALLIAQGKSPAEALLEIQGRMLCASKDRAGPTPPTPVTWQGTTYPTTAACARAHGVTTAIMAGMMKRAGAK